MPQKYFLFRSLFLGSHCLLIALLATSAFAGNQNVRSFQKMESAAPRWSSGIDLAEGWRVEFRGRSSRALVIRKKTGKTIELSKLSYGCDGLEVLDTKFLSPYLFFSVCTGSTGTPPRWQKIGSRGSDETVRFFIFDTLNERVVDEIFFDVPGGPHPTALSKSKQFLYLDTGTSEGPRGIYLYDFKKRDIVLKATGTDAKWVSDDTLSYERVVATGYEKQKFEALLQKIKLLEGYKNFGNFEKDNSNFTPYITQQFEWTNGVEKQLEKYSLGMME